MLTCTLHTDMNDHSVLDMGFLTYMRSSRACEATVARSKTGRGLILALHMLNT